MQKLDIRNTDGKLVGKFNPKTNTIELFVKGCLTTIRFTPRGGIKVYHTKCKNV